MSIYAIVNAQTGLIEGMTLWDGISEWSPGEGMLAVESTVAEAGIGWFYIDGVFSAPPLVDPAPADTLAANLAHQDFLLGQASQAMMPVLVSLQLGNATEAETAIAKSWQAYCRVLRTVDLTVQSPNWPDIPE